MATDNGLYRLAAVGAVLVGVFLAMGAYGHFEAVLPTINRNDSDVNAFALLLPGMILATAGLLSAILCKALWDGRPWSLNTAIAINTVALIYFAYLLWIELPGHPVAVFTGIVSCNLVLLVAIRMGLVWSIDQTASGNR